VFALEEAMCLDSGDLSKHLGYLPISPRYPASRPRCVLDDVPSDPRIAQEWQQRAVVAVYEAVADPPTGMEPGQEEQEPGQEEQELI
jgi:hypothetical protein